jgi:hypothetical protein
VKLTIEYRDGVRGSWKRSRMPWTFEDVGYLNRTAGYEKYRITRVTA